MFANFPYFNYLIDWMQSWLEELSRTDMGYKLLGMIPGNDNNSLLIGEPLWLSGKVVKNEKINEIERTRVCSPPRATSLKKQFTT
jgi:hypothetical protein